MPTTIDSAGITFNDTTSLTSANIGTAQLVNGSVTAAKLGTNEQKQIAKAWVNFSGSDMSSSSGPASTTETIAVTSGSNVGTHTISGFTWPSSRVGVIVKITQIGGVSNATLGGVDVSTLGYQITSVSGAVATFRLLSGTATASQSVVGTGSSASGFSYIITGIRSSYNVSSVTKNAVGDYTVNFATPMADANYAPLVTAQPNTADGIGSSNSQCTFSVVGITGSASLPSTSGYRIWVGYAGTNPRDVSGMYTAVFGN